MRPTGEITIKLTVRNGSIKVEDVYEDIKTVLKEDYGCTCKCLSMKDLRPIGNYKDLEDGDIECSRCGNAVHTSFDYVKTVVKDGKPHEYYKCLLCNNIEEIWWE